MIQIMERKNKVYLVRHGQVKNHEEIPVYGHTDVALTETGVQQLKRVAERLRSEKIGAVFASDLTRAVTGARQIGSHHQVPIRFIPEFREMYFGDWEGSSLGEIIKNFPEELEKRKKDPVHYACPGGGESISQLSERVMPVFERIRGEEPGKEIVIVAHGGVARVILCHALGLDLSRMFNIQQDYGCLNIIEYFPDSTLVRLING